MLGSRRPWEIDPATLRVLRTHPVGGYAGAVSADGRLFALGGQDGSVRLLDLETGDVRRFRGRHEGASMYLTFSTDAMTLVASDDSGEIVVWDVERGEIRERLPGPTGAVYDLAVSSDGRTLYSTAPDARMRIWDLAGDRRLDTRFDADPPMILDGQSPKGLALSPDGRTLAITHGDGTVDLVDARTLAVRRRLRVQRKAALGVAFSPDGRLLAVTGDGARVTLWDARTLAQVRELKGLKGSRRRSRSRPTAGCSRPGTKTARVGARSCGTCAPASPRPSERTARAEGRDPSQGGLRWVERPRPRSGRARHIPPRRRRRAEQDEVLAFQSWLSQPGRHERGAISSSAALGPQVPAA